MYLQASACKINKKYSEVKMKSLKIMAVTMVLLLALSVGSLYAEEPEVSGSASVDIMSSYIWRGFELHEDAAVQPSVGITYGGFGANLWSDYNTDPGEAVETDLTLNYTFSADKFSFDIGWIYFGLDGADDTQEIYASVGYDVLLSPTITIYYDIEEGSGSFITASIGHDIEFEKDIALSLGAAVSYNAESKYSIGDYSDLHNIDLSASLGIPVTKNISIAPMLAYTAALSDDAEAAIEALSADGDKSNFFYGGVNCTLSF
jgi:hypothetical protein